MKKVLLFLICILSTLENLSAMTVPEPSATVTLGSGSVLGEPKSDSELIEQYVKNLDDASKALQSHLDDVTITAMLSPYGLKDLNLLQIMQKMGADHSKYVTQGDTILSKISDAIFVKEIQNLKELQKAEDEKEVVFNSFNEWIKTAREKLLPVIKKIKAFAAEFRTRNCIT